MRSLNSLPYVLVLVLVGLWTANVPAEMLGTFSAGVGEEDRQERSEYSLKIITFVHGGSYLANVRIHIKDIDTDIVLFADSSEGPWLFVDLPVGSYSIIAERANGDRQGTRVQILADAPQVEVALVFPDR